VERQPTIANLPAVAPLSIAECIRARAGRERRKLSQKQCQTRFSDLESVSRMPVRFWPDHARDFGRNPKIMTVVRTGLVGTQANRNAGIPQLAERHDPAAEAEVANWIVRHYRSGSSAMF